jgi:hypothetical protein
VLGYNPEETSSEVIGDIWTPFRTIYCQLREAVAAHITEGIEPQLGILKHPKGAFNWEPTSNQHIISEVELAEEMGVQ